MSPVQEIAIVVGSHRHGSQSRKVANLAARILERELVSAATHLIDLSEASLPFWDEGVWAGDEKWQQSWAPVSETLQQCSGMIFVFPEWGGMVPAMLKNFFLLCSNNELAHKAGLLVAVSAGAGGSYPIAELRMSSYKNTRICYMPEHVIVRNVNDNFKDEEKVGDKTEQSLRDRMAYTLKVFMEYVKALSLVRDTKLVDLNRFPYGM